MLEEGEEEWELVEGSECESVIGETMVGRVVAMACRLVSCDRACCGLFCGLARLQRLMAARRRASERSGGSSDGAVLAAMRG